jgi:hypothetical protein
MAESDKAGITLDITPHIDWAALHGELAQALRDEVKHLLAWLLHRPCPVCSQKVS